MLITREMLIKRLSEKSSYWQKDIRTLLRCLDEVVLDCFNEATEDEEVAVQIITGCKIGCSVVPERIRKDPRTQADIVCAPTVKPNAKFSQEFRIKIQEQYNSKEDG